MGWPAPIGRQVRGVAHLLTNHLALGTMVPPEILTLWTHIGAGAVAVLGGAVAILTEKGGTVHRRAGKAFVASMAVVAGTAVALYPLGPTRFRLVLAMVAVFSFYLVFSGYRVLGRKRPVDAAGIPDWIAVVVVLVAGLGLLVVGLQWALLGRSFAPVFLVFGGIATTFGASDVRRYRSDEEGRQWMLPHLQRMLAGYIAAISAVSAVNLAFLPPYVAWLWPTVVGTPLIFWWSRRYS